MAFELNAWGKNGLSLCSGGIVQNVAYLKPINQNRALKKIADSLHEIKKYDILECFESSGVGFMEGDILRNITGYFFGEYGKLTKDLWQKNCVSGSKVRKPDFSKFRISQIRQEFCKSIFHNRK